MSEGFSFGNVLRSLVPQREGGSVYGYCPECGAEGFSRERRPNGNDKCKNGHSYPSANSLENQPVQRC